MASLNNPIRCVTVAHTRRIIVISDKLYFDKRVSLPAGEFRARSRATGQLCSESAGTFEAG